MQALSAINTHTFTWVGTYVHTCIMIHPIILNLIYLLGAFLDGAVAMYLYRSSYSNMYLLQHIAMYVCR